MMGMGGGGGFGGGYNPMETGRFNVPFTGGNMGMDMHRIPIVGNMFQNPYDQFKQQQMQNAAGAYSMYRPEAMQGWMNAQNQQSAQLQPMNNALAAMYGTGATQGFEAQNPFGPTAFTRGAAVGTDPRMPQAPGAAPGGFGMPPAQGPQGRPDVIGQTFGDREMRAGLSEDWRLGIQDPASMRHQDEVMATGGLYGAGGTFNPGRY